jgi:hypothetical protein
VKAHNLINTLIYNKTWDSNLSAAAPRAAKRAVLKAHNYSNVLKYDMIWDSNLSAAAPRAAKRAAVKARRPAGGAQSSDLYNI